ncbi:hypothetical protein ABFS82_08G063800 [Erythranthe guttata]|uniref:Hydroxyproline-rich glycoprotein family protein n=1 Tax=Erythranthe guttata TaxID=4155 RepID=A0A022QVQ5_ERYGU|nr:PREDICTED: uncharacterized protein At5g65660 [Erythranthe guttata]EYU31659.1 hypothetical protein MIMGU_mgv1a016107mg [Erythranthe guttata]|eukprot:XP_012844274.1 PREDICTED: uncharacterized protein At5g65660 [Erythranthe guttata]
MEGQYHGGAPISHSGGSRPSLGFPLGTALLLVVIFSLSGIFSCCYHWDKLRRTLSLNAAADLEADGDLGPSKPKNPHLHMKKEVNQSLPVIMPGDNVPRFIALPCPCEPPRLGQIAAVVQKPPPKPPRIAVPLY